MDALKGVLTLLPAARDWEPRHAWMPFGGDGMAGSVRTQSTSWQSGHTSVMLIL
ncbi:MAG: hypothetical protein ACJ8BW_23220 [Ktedonobacteraceae bacterium]|jgi:hypothetical protein